MRELLRIGGMNVYDLLQEHFQSPLLQGAIGLDAVLGTNLGPRSPGTVMTLLYRLAAQFGGRRPRPGAADGRNGRGRRMHSPPPRVEAGAEIRTGTAVARVLVQDDRACGVRLASGQEIAATTVISSADPKTSFIGLVGAEHLDAGFVRQVSHLRTQGAAAKLHLALAALPAFTDLPADAHGARLLIAPSLDYLEHAYNHSKYGEYSQSPALEITLAERARCAAWRRRASTCSRRSCNMPRTALPAAGHRNARDLPNRVIDTIAQYAPGLRELVIASELLTPEDMEQEFRVTGGHWHHEDLALDQFFMVRPVPGAAQYATPLPGFYCCGAGCHPGGGVMGLAGRNAARQVLAEAAHEHGSASAPRRRTFRQPLLPTPFHERARALSQVDSFVPWAGYSTVDVFSTMEQEYFAIRNATTLFDLTPMVKYRIAGADAARFLNRLVTRDVSRLKVNRVSYCVWCNDDGAHHR